MKTKKLLALFASLLFALAILITCEKDNYKDLIGKCPITEFTVQLSSLPEAGGTTLGSGTFLKDTTLTVTATPNSGYTFTNWTEESTVLATSTDYTFTLDTNKVFVANFTPIVIGNLTVTLKSNPLEGGTTLGAGSFAPGTSVTITATPTPDTYTFTNWTEGTGTVVASTTASLTFTLTKDTTLVANFAPVIIPVIPDLTVTLKSNPLDGGTTIGAGSFAPNTSVTVTANPNTDFTFTNWTEGTGTIVASTDATLTFILTQDTTLVANFAPVVIVIPPVTCTPAVDLKAAGNYEILSETGISTTGTTSVTGDLGVSSYTSTSITGDWALALVGTYSTSTRVTGKVYAADYTEPTPSNLTTAVTNMSTAYTEANGLAPSSAATIELGAGTLSGNLLTAGVYKWGTDLLITTDITLDGGGDDCAQFVFQVAGFLDVSSNVNIKLQNGAHAKNIFWVVAGEYVSLGTTSIFNGNILSLKYIAVKTGGIVNGRLLSQSAVTLDAATIKLP